MKVQPLLANEISQAAELLKSGNDKTAKRNYLLFLIGCNTGLRISDLLGLTLADLKSGRIMQQKTKKTVYIPVIQELITYTEGFCKICGLSDNDLIFNSMQKRRLSYIQAYRIMKEIGNKLGKNTGCHTTRKTFGRMLYDKTKDVALTAQALGHKDLSSVLHYIGKTDDELTVARKEIGLIGG